MQQFLILCLGMCIMGMLTDAVVVDVAKSQTWEWSHDLVPDVGLSARVTVHSGGYATAYISYSGKPTLDSYDEKYTFVEGIETVMYFPGQTEMVYALVQANDECDVNLEGFVKEGKINGCDFNFCSADEKCIAISDSQLICTAAK